MTETNRHTVDGDHFCQSSIRISVDPTVGGRVTPPTDFNLFIRMTITLKGAARAKADNTVGPANGEQPFVASSPYH